MKKLVSIAILSCLIFVLSSCSKPEPNVEFNDVETTGVFSYISGTMENTKSISAIAEDGTKIKADVSGDLFSIPVRTTENEQKIKIKINGDENQIIREITIPGVPILDDYREFSGSFNMLIKNWDKNHKTVFPIMPSGGGAMTVSKEGGVEATINLSRYDLLGVQFRSNAEEKTDLGAYIVTSAYALNAYDEKINSTYINMLKSKEKTKITINGITFDFDYNNDMAYVQIYR